MLKLSIKKHLLWSCMLVSLTSLGVYLFAAEKSPPEARSLADSYQKQGNYRDAWELYQKLATRQDSSATEVVHDLQAGIQCPWL